jgi:hypothetical protein
MLTALGFDHACEHEDDLDVLNCPQCGPCDCCQTCFGQITTEGFEYYSCGPYPEYHCPGECQHRGFSGHLRRKPLGDPDPELDFPERVRRPS